LWHRQNISASAANEFRVSDQTSNLLFVKEIEKDFQNRNAFFRSGIAGFVEQPINQWISNALMDNAQDQQIELGFAEFPIVALQDRTVSLFHINIAFTAFRPVQKAVRVNCSELSYRIWFLQASVHNQRVDLVRANLLMLGCLFEVRCGKQRGSNNKRLWKLRNIVETHEISRSEAAREG